MNTTLEQRLKELVNDAEQFGAPAVHTVINLLLAAHANGNHHGFAQHCCQFSPCAVELKALPADQSTSLASRPIVEFDDDSWDWDLGA